MKESTTYQAILADGTKRILLCMDGKRFGTADARTRTAIEAPGAPGLTGSNS